MSAMERSDARTRGRYGHVESPLSLARSREVIPFRPPNYN
jgi:hypothetical protein